MKVNAPEKLYFFEGEPILSARSKKVEGTAIEYTHTDAFIDKACEWLKENADMYEAFDSESKSYFMDKDKLVEDFKKLFKEE